MDQAMVDWAVTAMDFGEDTVRAEQWFTLFAAAYHDPDEGEPVGGWDEFVARLYPAAEREGFDSAQVQFFVESLRDSCSDPIGDVVLPMYEQRDTLPQEYLNLRAARAGETAEYDGGHAVHEAVEVESPDQPTEHEWHWDDSQQIWHRLEDNEWVPQVQNGHALNYERTEWVLLEPEAPAEEAEAVAEEAEALAEIPEAVAEPVSAESDAPSETDQASEASAPPELGEQTAEGAFAEPAETAEPADAASEAVGHLVDDALQGLFDDSASVAAELDIAEEDLIALISELPDEFINEVVQEAAAQAGASETASADQ